LIKSIANFLDNGTRLAEIREKQIPLETEIQKLTDGLRIDTLGFERI
jgi:hypothetical protein